jgi:hypothetical protein
VSINFPAARQIGVRIPTFLRHLLLFAWTIAWLCAPNGWAVIRIDTPVTHIYDLAELVLIGRVERIDGNEKVVEAEIVKVSKGNFAGDRVQIQMAGASDYLDRIAVNQPVVIFNGLKSALVHVGDNFLSAEPLASDDSLKLKVTKVDPIQWSFPGRTAALVRLVDEMASGHPTLLNLIEHVVWNGGLKEWGKVLPNADYVVASDLNGDGKADVLIGNGKATQLLINIGAQLKDETVKWGLRKARGKWAAFGDVTADKRPDILIGTRLWLNKGDHFVAGHAVPFHDDANVLTVALIDCTGDGRPDAAFLLKNGDLQVFENPGNDKAEWRALPVRHLWRGGDEAVAAAFSADWGDTGKPCLMVVRSSGLTRYALDPDGGPPAELDRLTGNPLKAYNDATEVTHWNVVAIVPLDINGDGLQDLIVILDKDGPTLVNRGFGTFFLNTMPTNALHDSYDTKVPWKLTPKTHFGAGDIHGDKFDDLLIVTEDGRLFELDNTPYEHLENRFK